MGSGLILLVIVGAWLAVLVPMALRSHDVSNLGTVDKFHDAMRVLSRRDRVVPGERDGVGDTGLDVSDADVERPEVMPSRDVVLRRSGRPEQAAATPGPREVRTVRPAAPVAGRRAATDSRAAAGRTGLTPAARRRRALLVLLVVGVGTLAGGLLGPVWLLVPHALTDLALVGAVLWLRKQAVLKEEREWRAAMSRRQAPRRPVAAPRPLVAPTHVVGVPDRMPSRAVLDGRHVPVAPAVRREDPAPVPARGAQGEPWQPIPVPVPTYVTAPTAPRRPLDLTRAGDAAADLAEAERSLGIDDQGPELDEILDRRRAVGD